MTLERIRVKYGDYLDVNTGKMYQMSKAIDSGEGYLLIPIVDNYTNQVIGYAQMKI